VKRQRINPSLSLKSYKEQTHSVSCHVPGCTEAGDHKAPKERTANARNPSDYYYFCMAHVQMYNKSWDYFRNMSEGEILQIRNQDVVWDRPSWPFGQNGSEDQAKDFQAFAFMHNWQKFSEDIFDFMDGDTAKAAAHNSSLSTEQEAALSLFNIMTPFTTVQLKKTYKGMVKEYHPDVNKGDKTKEDIFKKLPQAYKVLQELCIDPVQ